LPVAGRPKAVERSIGRIALQDVPSPFSRYSYYFLHTHKESITTLSLVQQSSYEVVHKNTAALKRVALSTNLHDLIC
jgi:hypothetical protein